MDFKQFFEQNTIGYHNDGPGSGFNPSGALFTTSDVTGSEASPKMTGNPLHLPSMDAGIPLVQKSGVIKYLELKKNPIFMMLSDGTRLFFTWDEFKRIKGDTPSPGKRIVVTMQRNPLDKTSTSSQIQDIFCN